MYFVRVFFFLQAEDGIRDLVRSRGLGDVYKRQVLDELERRDLAIGLVTLCAGGGMGIATIIERV